MVTDTEITPQNAYKPFGSVPLPDAPMSSVTPEATEVARDNDVTETRDSTQSFCLIISVVSD